MKLSAFWEVLVVVEEEALDCACLKLRWSASISPHMAYNPTVALAQGNTFLNVPNWHIPHDNCL